MDNLHVRHEPVGNERLVLFQGDRQGGQCFGRIQGLLRYGNADRSPVFGNDERIQRILFGGRLRQIHGERQRFGYLVRLRQDAGEFLLFDLHDRQPAHGRRNVHVLCKGQKRQHLGILHHYARQDETHGNFVCGNEHGKKRNIHERKLYQVCAS